MKEILRKIKPNIVMLELGLIIIAITSIACGQKELAAMCIGGIIAFGKDLLK